jgi:hypothetical protein
LTTRPGAGIRVQGKGNILPGEQRLLAEETRFEQNQGVRAKIVPRGTYSFYWVCYYVYYIIISKVLKIK